MSQFIGRGEVKTEFILGFFFGVENVVAQVPISRLVSPALWEWYDPELQKHKFDFYVLRKSKVEEIPDRNFAVEVNFEHGEKITAKYRKILVPDLKENNIEFLNINDWDCLSLFKKKPLTWQDYIDVLEALKVSEIKI
jgi:hypothetical protein